jgi:hypothetical protein
MSSPVLHTFVNGVFNAVVFNRFQCLRNKIRGRDTTYEQTYQTFCVNAVSIAGTSNKTAHPVLWAVIVHVLRCEVNGTWACSASDADCEQNGKPLSSTSELHVQLAWRSLTHRLYGLSLPHVLSPVSFCTLWLTSGLLRFSDDKASKMGCLWMMRDVESQQRESDMLRCSMDVQDENTVKIHSIKTWISKICCYIWRQMCSRANAIHGLIILVYEYCLWTFMGTQRTAIGSSLGLYLYRQRNRKIQKHIHAPSGFRIHNSGAVWVEDLR